MSNFRVKLEIAGYNALLCLTAISGVSLAAWLVCPFLGYFELAQVAFLGVPFGFFAAVLFGATPFIFPQWYRLEENKRKLEASLECVEASKR